MSEGNREGVAIKNEKGSNIYICARNGEYMREKKKIWKDMCDFYRHRCETMREYAEIGDKWQETRLDASEKWGGCADGERVTEEREREQRTLREIRERCAKCARELKGGTR